MKGLEGVSFFHLHKESHAEEGAPGPKQSLPNTDSHKMKRREGPNTTKTVTPEH